MSQNLSSSAVVIGALRVNSLLTCVFANISDPDQAQQNVEPDQDPNSEFDTLMVKSERTFCKIQF